MATRICRKKRQRKTEMEDGNRSKRSRKITLEKNTNKDAVNPRRARECGSTCSSQAAPPSASPPPRPPGENGIGLGDFPVEVILAILRRLPIRDLKAACGVCKRWWKLRMDPSLWKTVSFERTVADKLPWYFWKKLDRLATTCLDFHSCVDSLCAPKTAIPKIVKLRNVTSICFGVVEKRELQLVLQHMPQLTHLQVSYLLPSIYSREEKILCDLGRFSVLRNLEELRLSSMYSLDLPTIAFSGGTQTLSQLKKLRKLILSNFECLDGPNLLFLQNLPLLQHLELGNCSVFTPLTFSMLRSLKNLKSLSLTHAHCTCQRRHCACMAFMLQEFHSLTNLTLMMCVIPRNLNSTLREMKHIQMLEIWPYLDRVYPPFIYGGAIDQTAVGKAYVNLFFGLGYLCRATVGILNELQLGTAPSSATRTISDENSSDDGGSGSGGGDDDDAICGSFDPGCSRVNSDGFPCEEENGKNQRENEPEGREIIDKNDKDSEERRKRSPLIDGAPQNLQETVETVEQENLLNTVNVNKIHNDCSKGLEPQTSPCQRDGIESKWVTFEKGDAKIAVADTDATESSNMLGLFQSVKQGMLQHMPSTHLTLYEVTVNKYGKDTGMEMYYISRVEEEFTVLDI